MRTDLCIGSDGDIGWETDVRRVKQVGKMGQTTVKGLLQAIDMMIPSEVMVENDPKYLTIGEYVMVSR